MYEKILFVYMKDDLITVEYLDDARILEDSREWEHIGTLEPKGYIQTILEENKFLVDRMRDIETNIQTD